MGGSSDRRRSRCAADGDLQGRIGTQHVHVIAVLVSGQDRIATVTQRSRYRLGQIEPLCDLAQHVNAASFSTTRPASNVAVSCLPNLR